MNLIHFARDVMHNCVLLQTRGAANEKCIDSVTRILKICTGIDFAAPRRRAFPRSPSTSFRASA